MPLPVTLVLALLSAAPLRDGATQFQVLLDGAKRTGVVRPGLHALQEPSPVVLIFHGHGGHAPAFINTTGFDEEWPEATIVSLQGLKAPGARDPEGEKPGWQKNPGELEDRDLHFVDKTLEVLQGRYKVDKSRIYAAGFSNGARMTYLLWAKRPDVFAAVAPCASQFISDDLALTARPKPAFVIQGLKDRQMPISGAKQSFAAVLKANGCGAPANWSLGETHLKPGASGADTALYVHRGAHLWPRDITPSVVKFFKGHAK